MSLPPWSNRLPETPCRATDGAGCAVSRSPLVLSGDAGAKQWQSRDWRHPAKEERGKRHSFLPLQALVSPLGRCKGWRIRTDEASNKTCVHPALDIVTFAPICGGANLDGTSSSTPELEMCQGA
eukprot:1330320-Amphidinium_carterae.1